jgi:hypothetical protein
VKDACEGTRGTYFLPESDCHYLFSGHNRTPLSNSEFQKYYIPSYIPPKIHILFRGTLLSSKVDQDLYIVFNSSVGTVPFLATITATETACFFIRHVSFA